jgi:hypothetical protein
MGKKHVQRWGPDTCGCKIVMVRDDRDDPNSHFHFIEGSILASDGEKVEGMVVCPDHKGLTRAGVWETTFANDDSENKRKNLFIGEVMADLSIGLCVDEREIVMEDHPVLGQVPKLDAHGNQVTRDSVVFKPGVEVRHIFVGKGLHRAMEMWVVGMPVTSAMRTRLEACASRCGSARAPIVVKAQVEIA